MRRRLTVLAATVVLAVTGQPVNVHINAGAPPPPPVMLQAPQPLGQAAPPQRKRVVHIVDVRKRDGTVERRVYTGQMAATAPITGGHLVNYGVQVGKVPAGAPLGALVGLNLGPAMGSYSDQPGGYFTADGPGGPGGGGDRGAGGSGGDGDGAPATKTLLTQGRPEGARIRDPSKYDNYFAEAKIGSMRPFDPEEPDGDHEGAEVDGSGPGGTSGGDDQTAPLQQSDLPAEGVASPGGDEQVSSSSSSEEDASGEPNLDALLRAAAAHNRRQPRQHIFIPDLEAQGAVKGRSSTLITASIASAVAALALVGAIIYFVRRP